MEHSEIERIALTILRDYGLPFRFEGVTASQAGRCAVGFTHAFSGGAPLSVNIWCDAKTSPHRVRESLKSGLDVSD